MSDASPSEQWRGQWRWISGTGWAWLRTKKTRKPRPNKLVERPRCYETIRLRELRRWGGVCGCGQEIAEAKPPAAANSGSTPGTSAKGQDPLAAIRAILDRTSDEAHSAELKALRDTRVKKSELKSAVLPATQVRKVQKGALWRGVARLDSNYWLVRDQS